MLGRGRLGDVEERREVVSLEKLIKLKNNVNVEKNKMKNRLGTGE